MSYKSKILATRFVTHNVKNFILEKPDGFSFTPGQSTSLTINQEGWLDKKRPFTFTGLSKDHVLELTIKGYFDHDGVTKKLHGLESGDEVLLEDPWGSISYKERGVFIAGGAGITPFIAIFRDLVAKNELKGNILIFANKGEKDIILQKELEGIFEAEDLFFILSQEEHSKYDYGRVDEKYLQTNVDDFKKNFYLCGPPQMTESLKLTLGELGADISQVVF